MPDNVSRSCIESSQSVFHKLFLGFPLRANSRSFPIGFAQGQDDNFNSQAFIKHALGPGVTKWRFTITKFLLVRIVPLIALALLLPRNTFAQQAPKPHPSIKTPWLFAGFKGNSEDGVYYALSLDGYHWTLANGGKPVVHQTEPNELMRDPFLQRAPDGSIRMVWTWAWRSPTVLGYSSSRDLIHWTKHRQLPVMTNEPTALNVWAPALYYDATQKNWIIFWSSTIPGRFPGDDSGDGNLNHRIWSTTTKDFAAFTPAKVFFDPGYSVIDATLLPPPIAGAPYTLIFKDERKTPLEKHLQTAQGPTLEGPWSRISPPLSETWSEGAAIVPVQDGFLAYYDHYQKPQHYGAIFSRDLNAPLNSSLKSSWTDAADKISFPEGMRHGSFLRITSQEYKRLAALK